jgi:hypothetical protein
METNSIQSAICPNDYEDFVKKRKEQRMKERDEERNKKDFDDDKRYGDSDEIEPPRRRHEDYRQNI